MPDDEVLEGVCGAWCTEADTHLRHGDCEIGDDGFSAGMFKTSPCVCVLPLFFLP